ncbi:MAG: hypothetical protein JNJ46_01540 [Myxococcales bacterium]|nr:hypothetical protein [Myxococcales bacterium]
MLLFNCDVPDGSDVTIQVRLGILAGRRLIAWSGPPGTSEDQIIEEISNNSAVARYLQKPIERGKVRPDEYDCVTVDAYLTALEGERITTEHKIKISFPLPTSVSDPHSAHVQMERMFAQFSAAMSSIVSQATQSITQVTQHASHLLSDANKSLGQTQAEGAKVLQVTAEHSAKLLESVAQPFNKTLDMMQQAYTHESTRADRASDAVIRMLNAKEHTESATDSLVKIVTVMPTAVTAIKGIAKAIKEN